ncbi:MAG: 4-hydroxythreonine-4-phosphate dehydrogenase PdxA [Bacteroidota bacterium]
MKTNSRGDSQIRVGITHGDINGIGYEIIIKTFADARILDFCIPVIYGSSKVASYHKKMVAVEDFNFHIIKNISEIAPKKVNLINCIDKELKIDLGTSTPQAGEASYLSLQYAMKDLKEGKIDFLLTAPINKDNIQSKDFKFPGHTEYLAKEVDAKDYLMMLVCDKVRVGVATGHVPLHEVSSVLSTDLILNKIKVMNESLINDFGILKPKIAVLGLNPHAGDNGLLGKEEKEIIRPAIDKALENGMSVFGPYPSDGFFGKADYMKFDGVLAMYHDQGLIPFKTLCFDQGVNFTAGLPIIRTSPDHGTGYDIAGKDIAAPDSFRSALYLGLDILKNRNSLKELKESAMGK